MKLAFFYNKNHIDIKDLKLLDSKNHDKKRKNTFLDKRSTIHVRLGIRSTGYTSANNQLKILKNGCFTEKAVANS
ncbi:hypothetical protein F4U02_09025 [Acinetobacter haemolyticus]|uniref:Uncharacterized protein n=1 Tax=Acinetobacter haemolyticus ATCC 19194 TaxID=707232 RepID=D4XSG0_ACIHA|nr:hypothetical protein HMP0015_2652 [Acinetobacter haemolyticus ATCC 19194]MQZ31134.1 hypothetical protein [Acinetobacter haemolyticus]QDJ91645.1 hypothetical protein AhaeAN54_005910 [Acinetobacter haemolyticus]RSN78802.1 hypothetical protein EA769_00165 [Acinetobacter haemolyticus]